VIRNPATPVTTPTGVVTCGYRNQQPSHSVEEYDTAADRSVKPDALGGDTGREPRGSCR